MSRYAIDTIHGAVCGKHLIFLSPLILILILIQCKPCKGTVLLSDILSDLIPGSGVLPCVTTNRRTGYCWFPVFEASDRVFGVVWFTHFWCTCIPGVILQWHNTPIACHHMYIEHSARSVTLWHANVVQCHPISTTRDLRRRTRAAPGQGVKKCVRAF